MVVIALKLKQSHGTGRCRGMIILPLSLTNTLKRGLGDKQFKPQSTSLSKYLSIVITYFRSNSLRF